MSESIVNSEENAIVAPELMIQPDELEQFIIFIPSEMRPVKSWSLVRASNLTCDSDADSRNITMEPLTPNELADVEASRTEMSTGESKHFNSVNDAISWLDRE